MFRIKRKRVIIIKALRISVLSRPERNRFKRITDINLSAYVISFKERRIILQPNSSLIKMESFKYLFYYSCYIRIEIIKTKTDMICSKFLYKYSFPIRFHNKIFSQYLLQDGRSFLF